MGTCVLCRVTRHRGWALTRGSVAEAESGKIQHFLKDSPFTYAGPLDSIEEHGFRPRVLNSTWHLTGSSRKSALVVPTRFCPLKASGKGMLGLFQSGGDIHQRRLCTPVRALAKEAARPSLDDVERLSKGKPSKAKIGSRSVPHRLTAAERKTYDISKKKGYLVMRTNSRSYPLANTWRNFCEASGTPYIKIEQGSVAESDTFYVDFSPMREDPARLETLREACLAEAAKIIAKSDDVSGRESDGSTSEFEEDSGISDAELSALKGAQFETLEANEYDQVSEGGYAFRLVCSRQEAKAIGKAVLEIALKRHGQ